MKKPSLDDQVDMLRVQLETILITPALMVLSSARSCDGLSVVASKLAKSMDAAGYSTLYVCANSESTAAAIKSGPDSLDELTEAAFSPFAIRSSRSGVRVIRISGKKIHRTASRESVARFHDACKKAFQITIVEASNLLANSFGMLSAAASDGVLLTIQEGRRLRAEDNLLAKQLAHEGTSFLGVVSVGASLTRIIDDGAMSEHRSASIPIVTADPSATREEQIV